MNKNLFTALLLCSTIVTTSVNAAGYLALRANAVDTTINLSDKAKFKDNLLGGSIALGIEADQKTTDKMSIRMDISYDYNNYVRSREKETSGDIKDIIFRNNDIMINAYFDIPVGYSLTPYIMAGAGISNMYTKYSEYDHTTHVTASTEENRLKFASQAGLGFTTNIGDNINIDAGYRYVRHGILNFKDVATVRSTSNVYSVGIRVAY